MAKVGREEKEDLISLQNEHIALVYASVIPTAMVN